MTNKKENDNLRGTCEVPVLVPPAPEFILEDQLSEDDEESVGFNPYDTAVLYKR